jgi:membrane-associated protein
MFDIQHIVSAYGIIAGYIILFSIIFAETGLFFGFFLPGDSILFPAGVLASQGFFNIYWLCILSFIAAVLGNAVGYLFGKHFGKKLFNREDSLLFHKNHITTAREFYKKHGGKTILLARFIPIIRTFGPIVAGVSDMPFLSFLGYSIGGAIIWAVGVPVAGYYLGKLVGESVDRYLLPIVALIVIVSILPGVYHALNTKEKREKVTTSLRKILAR